MTVAMEAASPMTEVGLEGLGVTVQSGGAEKLAVMSASTGVRGPLLWSVFSRVRTASCPTGKDAGGLSTDWAEILMSAIAPTGMSIWVVAALLRLLGSETWMLE